MKTVSLVLTTYNCKDNLKITFDSIEKQDYQNVEVLIKDGGSTDGTLEVIKNYQQRSKYYVEWKSEPDEGIYDAMNHGYEMCAGEIVVFFNDVFTSVDTISRMVEMIENNPGCIGAHADLVYKDGDKVVRKWHMGEGSIYHGWMPGHPTLFLKREIYEKYGLYDTSYKIAADYEFMIRFLKEESNQLVYLPETVVSMFYGGTSSGGLSNYLLSLKEGYDALRKNGIHIMQACWITIRRTVKVLRQFR